MHKWGHTWWMLSYILVLILCLFPADFRGRGGFGGDRGFRGRGGRGGGYGGKMGGRSVLNFGTSQCIGDQL